MSVRAYKLKEIKTEESPTFNLWNNETIYYNLVDTEQLDNNGGGLITIQEDSINNLIKNIKSGDIKVKQDESKKNILFILQKMSKQAENDSYIEYYCY